MSHKSFSTCRSLLLNPDFGRFMSSFCGLYDFRVPWKHKHQRSRGTVPLQELKIHLTGFRLVTDYDGWLQLPVTLKEHFQSGRLWNVAVKCSNAVACFLWLFFCLFSFILLFLLLRVTRSPVCSSFALNKIAFNNVLWSDRLYINILFNNITMLINFNT